MQPLSQGAIENNSIMDIVSHCNKLVESQTLDWLVGGFVLYTINQDSNIGTKPGSGLVEVRISWPDRISLTIEPKMINLQNPISIVLQGMCIRSMSKSHNTIS